VLLIVEQVVELLNEQYEAITVLLSCDPRTSSLHSFLILQGSSFGRATGDGLGREFYHGDSPFKGPGKNLCSTSLNPDFPSPMHDRLRHGTYVTNQKTGALQAHSTAKPLDELRCDYAKAKTMALIGLPTAAQGTARGFFG